MENEIWALAQRLIVSMPLSRHISVRIVMQRNKFCLPCLPAAAKQKAGSETRPL